MGMEKEVDLVGEGLRKVGGKMVHGLKVGVEKVGGHLNLAEEGMREAAGMISSAH